MAVVALGTVCHSASAQVQRPRTVLTIHWGAESSPPTGPQDEGIRKVLLTQTAVPVNYFAEYLETEEFSPEVASIALRDYIHRKFEGRHIDVVIAEASAALQFAVRYRAELFPDAPIVFSAVALPRVVLDRTATGITGVLSDTPFGETLDLAMRLHPSVKRVFVVASAPSVQGYDERLRSALSRFSDRLEITYIQARTVPELVTAVKAIPGQSLLLYTRYVPNEPSPNMYTDDVARVIAEASPVPVYGVSDLYLGTGVVGGSMRHGEALGVRLGEIALQILKGARPESIPIANVPTRPVFDWRAVKRWGIDTSKLPPGSEILFRTPAAWETYRWYLIATIGVFALQSLLITGLLTQRTRRRRAEATLRAQEASLRTSYGRIRWLAGRLIHEQEAARAGIARDLHDDICQRLATVSMGVDFLQRSSGDIQDAALQEVFVDLTRNTRGAFDGIRRLSHELHPATLPLLGLGPAIRSFAAELGRRHNVQITVTTEGDFRDLTSDTAICFFRIAEESLRNAVVHGGARRLTVALIRSGDELDMTVADDGSGFDLEAERRRGHGLGLICMEERAHASGAVLSIATGPGRGTTVHVKRRVGASSPIAASHGGPNEDAPAIEQVTVSG